jgi:predicted RNA binding protein YcfA (HicA-like mRNA interferase family)
VLEHLGWQVVRQRSSHVRLELPDGSNPVTVPISQREVVPKTFKSILKQARLSLDEFTTVAAEVL